MGFETVAIARGAEKTDFAKQRGAHHYVDSTAAAPVAQALQSLGGARVVPATAGNSHAITVTVDGLAPRGELVAIGADPEPLGSSPVQLLSSGSVIRGHPSGTAQHVQDTMAFSALHGIRPMTETPARGPGRRGLPEDALRHRPLPDGDHCLEVIRARRRYESTSAARSYVLVVTSTSCAPVSFSTVSSSSVTCSSVPAMCPASPDS